MRSSAPREREEEEADHSVALEHLKSDDCAGPAYSDACSPGGSRRVRSSPRRSCRSSAAGVSFPTPAEMPCCQTSSGAWIRVDFARPAQIRPSQQRAEARTGAPRQLLCGEAGLSPCAPARRPYRGARPAFVDTLASWLGHSRTPDSERAPARARGGGHLPGRRNWGGVRPVARAYPSLLSTCGERRSRPPRDAARSAAGGRLPPICVPRSSGRSGRSRSRSGGSRSG